MDKSIKATDVICALMALFSERGAPMYLRSDNGPEFIEKTLKRWLVKNGGYYLIGSFVGISIYKWTGSFLLAILAGGAVAGIIGVGMERGFLRYLPGQLLDQVIPFRPKRATIDPFLTSMEMPWRT